MKLFFYAVVAVYLLLYFYAVYLYEGFTLVAALGFLAGLSAVSWLLFKGWSKKQDGQLAESVPVQTTLKWWQTPFPYLALIFLAVLIATAFI